MKQANAQLYYSVLAKCPYCGADQDLTSDVESGVDIEAAATSGWCEDLEIIVKCQECCERFELNDIDR